MDHFTIELRTRKLHKNNVYGLKGFCSWERLVAAMAQNKEFASVNEMPTSITICDDGISWNFEK